MIQSFADKVTENVFNGRQTKLSSLMVKQAARKLDMINLVTSIAQLKIPPGNQLEKLSGKYLGYYSIRVNKQYRIIFQWLDGEAYNVQLTDYHG
ncbi:MAG: type II toxin-antitoxin system RelE/ParE family toxin [Desulfohalobiaceae bacterium]